MSAPLLPEGRDDARPAWMLRDQRKISSLRRLRHGDAPLDAATWWAQIVVVAAELNITTRWEDWQRWPS